MSLHNSIKAFSELLSEFLAPGVEVSDVPELSPLLQASSLIASFITLFRGSDAEVLARLLVLREISRQTDETPRWSTDTLRTRFSYLDSVKLETVLKRLRDNALLALADNGQYYLSDLGRNAVAAISSLLHFSAEEDLELGFLTTQLAGLQAVGAVNAEALGHLLSKLNELAWRFEEAIASGSEFRIQAARRKLSANSIWLEKGTAVMNTLLADPDVSFELASVAQRIGLAQSRLSRADAAFQRALNKIEAQRVTLGAFGISSSDVAGWLHALPSAALATLADGGISPAPFPIFLAGNHELLDRAESLLSNEIRYLDENATLPSREETPTALVPEQDKLDLLERLTERLMQLSEPSELAYAVVGGDFSAASYRLSLLAMLADGASTAADASTVSTFMGLPVQVEFADELSHIMTDEVALISKGRLIPLRP